MMVMDFLRSNQQINRCITFGVPYVAAVAILLSSLYLLSFIPVFSQLVA